MAPFGFFKKKEREEPVEQAPAIAGTLSIQQAQDMLRTIESAKVQELAARLAHVKGSADRSLRIIEGLANDMEHEKIKLEDLEQRFKSVAENSRRTVVSSLRREASSELPLPRSINDAKKFRERFESMMNRFGEVSGSHSKMLNAFMKKHAGKMKSEFEALTKLLNETKAIMSEFEQERAPIVKCGALLNTASQKASSASAAEAAAQSIEGEIRAISQELERLKGELAALKDSPEFEQATAIAQKIAEAEQQQEQFYAQTTDLFSHASRAFTKYSYGVTKETEMRLQALSDEPWKVLYESDISPYSSLLLEVRKSIDSGSIQLKDSDKVLHYLDIILQSLPDLQGKAAALKSEIDSLRHSGGGLVRRAEELEERVVQHDDALARNRQNMEQQNRQAAEKSVEVDALLKEAGEILAGLTGQKYLLQR